MSMFGFVLILLPAVAVASMFAMIAGNQLQAGNEAREAQYGRPMRPGDIEIGGVYRSRYSPHHHGVIHIHDGRVCYAFRVPDGWTPGQRGFVLYKSLHQFASIVRYES